MNPVRQQRRRWRRAASAAGAGGALWALLPLAPAHATGTDLVVSVPSEPVAVTAGGSATGILRIANPGTDALQVTVTVRRLELGDDGRATVTEEPDPLWAGRTHVEQPSVAVPPGGYVDDGVTFSVPAGVRPDDYLVGFLVEPAVTGGSVRVVNRIGSFMQVSIPGPRRRALRIEALDAPRVVLGSGFDATVVLRNVGPSFLTTWGELDAAPWLAQRRHTDFGRNHIRISHGRRRSLGYRSELRFPIGPVRVRTVFFFNKTDRTVAAVQAGRTVWMLHPVYPVAALALAGALAGRRVRNHRRPRVAVTTSCTTS